MDQKLPLLSEISHLLLNRSGISSFAFNGVGAINFASPLVQSVLTGSAQNVQNGQTMLSGSFSDLQNQTGTPQLLSRTWYDYYFICWSL